MTEKKHFEESNETDNSNVRVESWTGYALAFLSSIISATGGLLVKIDAEDKMLIVLLRCMMQFLLLFPLASYKKIDLTGGNLKTLGLIMLRGFLSSVSMNAYAESLKYLPLGDAGAITYTYPAFVAFFACICLKGKCFKYVQEM